MIQRVKINEMEKMIAKIKAHDMEQAELILEKDNYSQSAHTEILKKKIHDLQAKGLANEAEIKKLNKLPNASLF